MSTYLDADVVIYVVEQHPVWGPPATARVRALQAQGELLLASDLTRLECRVGPLIRNDHALLLLFDSFLATVVTRVVPLARTICEQAAVIRAAYGFKTPDALHLAAAVEHGCHRFLTHDQRLSRFTGLTVEVL